MRRLSAIGLCLILGACAGAGGSGMMPRKAVSVDPPALVGDDGAAVMAALGQPPFRRTDGPAEIWQYRAPDCTLDLFLYKSGAGLVVRHQELRNLNSGYLDRPACLKALGEAIAEGMAS